MLTFSVIVWFWPWRLASRDLVESLDHMLWVDVHQLCQLCHCDNHSLLHNVWVAVFVVDFFFGFTDLFGYFLFPNTRLIVNHGAVYTKNNQKYFRKKTKKRWKFQFLLSWTENWEGWGSKHESSPFALYFLVKMVCISSSIFEANKV